MEQGQSFFESQLQQNHLYESNVSISIDVMFSIDVSGAGA